MAAAKNPINIGVIGDYKAIAGGAIINGAELAVDDINKAGGIDGRPINLIKFDSHASSSDAVRAFQRAVREDHVVAMVGSYISEIALALEPWSGRLKTPYITTGAASTDITKHVHDNYATYKYSFQSWINSADLAHSICDFEHDVIVKQLGYKSAVVMSENAAWTKPLDATYQKCLPEAGLKVLKTISFSPNTTDFTPIYNGIEALKPDLIVTGLSHVGVAPTVQWHNQQVPLLMTGISSQAGSSTFWKDTNGAAEGVVTETAAVPGIAITPKTVPFTEAYTKRFNMTPAYSAYSTYDTFYMLKQAIERAKSTKADTLVKALEKTDYTGTIGRMAFYPPNDKYAHGLRYGKGYFTGVMVQWQKGKQVTLWPANAANGSLTLPSFVKAATH